MIQITLSGQPAYLLNIPPDGRSPYRIDFQMLSNRERSLSGREIRRAVSTRLRCTSRFSLFADGNNAQRLKDGLRASRTERVAIPMWPLILRWTDRSSQIVDAGLWIAWKFDWSQWEIYQADEEPEWPGPGDFVAPVLVGRLSGRDLQWVHSSALSMNVEHIEASDFEYGIRFKDIEQEPGPTPSDAYECPPFVLPPHVDFVRLDQSVRITVERDQIGFGRQPLETNHDLPAVELHQSSIAFGGQIASVMSFFQCHASGSPFWAKSWISDVELPDDVAADQEVIPVSTTAGIRIGDWLAFQRADGTEVYSQVLDLNSETITLDTSPGPCSSRSTLVCRLILARFLRPQIAIEWVDTNSIRFTAPTLEVVEEYQPAEGEVLGATIGETCPTVWLYEIKSRIGDVDVVEHLTSHEVDLQVGNTLYLAANITHGQMIKGVALDRDEVEVRAGLTSSSLLSAVANLKSHAPVSLKIWRARISGVCGCKNQPPIDWEDPDPEDSLPQYDPENESGPPDPSGDYDDDEGGEYGEPFAHGSAWVWGWSSELLGSDPNAFFDADMIRCHMELVRAEVESLWPGSAVDTMKWVWNPTSGNRLDFPQRHMRLNPPYNDPPLPCSTLGDPFLNVSIAHSGYLELAVLVYPPAP